MDCTSTECQQQNGESRPTAARRGAAPAAAAGAPASAVSEEKDSGNRNRTLTAVITAAALFIFGIIFRRRLQETPHASMEYLVFLVAYFLVGGRVVWTALKNLARGEFFDENFLMTIATAGAILIHQLPEAIGVMLFFAIGEFFQDMAINRSRQSISALMDIRPDYANLKVQGEIQRVSPGDVAVGQVIVVKPGERIPLDGAVIQGTSFVDTSALTGESVPKKVEAGEKVLSGMVNGSGLLEVRVERSFAESSVSRILDLVERASARKAPTEQVITRFSRLYTPVVTAGALALAVVPPLVVPGATFGEWVYRALVLLVISCPCALVISIPLGYFGGIGGASRHGILVKGANFLEALAHLHTVVFDKTGTLTKGVFRVSEVATRNGFTREELLRFAALAESHSNHPIAKSIQEAYLEVRRDGANRAAAEAGAGAGVGVQAAAAAGARVETRNMTEDIKDETSRARGIIGKTGGKTSGGQRQQREVGYQEIAGHGIKAHVDGMVIVVGNDRLMHRENISHDSCDVEGTVVYVAIDRVFAGYIIISDEIKPDAARAVQGLRRLGARRIIMLTGDDEGVARMVASKLGMDGYFAELLPEDKVGKLEELESSLARRDGQKLAFAGDGINDAPVITRADVGIAMGGLGSDAAIEAADVVIMEDMPSRLVTAIEIARHTRRIIIQNIALALATKGAFIALGAVGAASMWEAVFADVGVALLAILNATRALRYNRVMQ